MQVKIRCIKIGIMITPKFNFPGLNTDEHIKKKLYIKDKISIHSSIPLVVVGRGELNTSMPYIVAIIAIFTEAEPH